MRYLIMHPQSRFLIRGENKRNVFEAMQRFGGKVTLSRRRESEDLAGSTDSSDPPLYSIQLSGWEWQLSEDYRGRGDIVEIIGLEETLGQESLPFDVMAPFVEAGSYLAMIDETDHCRRWHFDGTSVIEERPTSARHFNADNWNTDRRLYSTARMVHAKGRLFCELGEYQEAINCFDEVISLAPDFVDAYYSRGQAFLKIGETRRAIKDYIQALRLEGCDRDSLKGGGAMTKTTVDEEK
jgi:tetratricopeptide (TPR) repeat protein